MMTNEEWLKDFVKNATTEELANLIWHKCSMCAFRKSNSYGEGQCPDCNNGNILWLKENKQ